MIFYTMAQIKFIYNLDKDVKNIWDKCNNGAQFGKMNLSSEVVNLCRGYTLKKSKINLFPRLLAISNSDYMKNFLNVSQKLWNKIEMEYFRRMNKLMDRNYSENIFAYATTIPICPYDPNEPSFMVSIHYSLQSVMATCGHEIMHLYFHKFYWKDIEKKLGYKKTADLKEALTVLLNEEFFDLWLFKERGYDEHKDLRNFILKSWRKHKDFNLLLGDCVKYLSN